MTLLSTGRALENGGIGTTKEPEVQAGSNLYFITVLLSVIFICEYSLIPWDAKELLPDDPRPIDLK
jgi:hypothetical protein